MSGRSDVSWIWTSAIAGSVSVTVIIQTWSSLPGSYIQLSQVRDLIANPACAAPNETNWAESTKAAIRLNTTMHRRMAGKSARFFMSRNSGHAPSLFVQRKRTNRSIRPYGHCAGRRAKWKTAKRRSPLQTRNNSKTDPLGRSEQTDQPTQGGLSDTGRTEGLCPALLCRDLERAGRVRDRPLHPRERQRQ